MELRVKLDGDLELRATLRRLGSEAKEAMASAALVGAEVIRDEANRRAPGPHIHAEVVRTTRHGAEAHIGPDKEHWYYRFFETGAQPHPIRPRKKQGRKKLRFEVGGEEVFAVAVQHPGMAARPFLRPAFDENSKRAADAAGRALRKKLGI